MVNLVHQVCTIAGNRTLIDDCRVELAASGVIEAIRQRDNAAIFDWLIGAVSLQGVSDAAALGFIEHHEEVSSVEIERRLSKKPRCPKLRGYHVFHGCGYRKWKDSCAQPLLKDSCPLPRHDLRRGGLNIAAYSLVMFMRDVCSDDFVGWLDHQLIGHHKTSSAVSDDPVIGPMSFVQGIGPKTLSMAMSTFLMSGDIGRSHWINAGVRMIAVDSLVHNWMHRTGILHRLKASHPYGASCYQAGGCAEIIEHVSSRIDAREFNPDYPKDFPRFVQFALWRFCSVGELNTCNGVRIKDTERCRQNACELYGACDRRRLNGA